MDIINNEERNNNNSSHSASFAIYEANNKTETPDLRKKRVLNRRLKNAHKAMQTLVNTFDQPYYPYEDNDIVVAEELFKELVYDGIFVDMIHAGRTRQQRDNTVEAFRAGKGWVLICTDLMGRGVDFKGVNVVVNYDMPQSAETYIHRIGRTGRAGRKGTAITIFSDQDYPYLRSIVSVVRASGCEVPEYMKSLPKPARKRRKNADYKPIERWTISTKVHKNIRQTKSMREMKKRTKAQSE